MTVKVIDVKTTGRGTLITSVNSDGWEFHMTKTQFNKTFRPVTNLDLVVMALQAVNEAGTAFKAKAVKGGGFEIVDERGGSPVYVEPSGRDFAVLNEDGLCLYEGRNVTDAVEYACVTLFTDWVAARLENVR